MNSCAKCQLYIDESCVFIGILDNLAQIAFLVGGDTMGQKTPTNAIAGKIEAQEAKPAGVYGGYNDPYDPYYDYPDT
jgi:hypothetical protein